MLILNIGSFGSSIKMINVDNEKLVREVISFKGPKDSQCIGYRRNEGENIVGYKNGKVIVWNELSSNIVCTFN